MKALKKIYKDFPVLNIKQGYNKEHKKPTKDDEQIQIDNLLFFIPSKFYESYFKNRDPKSGLPTAETEISNLDNLDNKNTEQSEEDEFMFDTIHSLKIEGINTSKSAIKQLKKKSQEFLSEEAINNRINELISIQKGNITATTFLFNNQKLSHESIYDAYIALTANGQAIEHGAQLNGNDYYRDDFVGIYDGIGNLIHKPINHLRITNSMSDLFKYLNEPSRKNVLDKPAAAHVIFEYIHPYFDGNGRMGRILLNREFNKRNLYHNGPAKFLSFYIQKNKEKYYRSLNDSQRTLNIGYFMAFLNEAITYSQFSINLLSLTVFRFQLQPWYIEVILNILAELTDIININEEFNSSKVSKAFEGYSRQRQNQLLTDLVNNGILIKKENKKSNSFLYQFNNEIWKEARKHAFLRDATKIN